MNEESIAQMIDEMNMPNAYDHFAEGEAVDPPFIVFLLPASDNFSADNGVYVKVQQLRIELYTDVKDPEAEKTVQTVLDAHEIFYQKSEVWIPEEHLYEVIYEMEVPMMG